MAINYLPEDEETGVLPSLAPAPRRKMPGEQERGAFDIPQVDVIPDWLSAAMDSGTMPVSGGPAVGLSDILPSIPQSKEELALQAAGVLIPGLAGKAATATAPALSRALGKRAPAFLKGLTGEAVFAESRAKRNPLTFSKFVEKYPEAGAEMFDIGSAKPAIEGRPMLERYRPKKPSKRVVEAMARPEVQEQLIATAEKGAQMMPASWYRTSPLYQYYQQKYGDNAAKLYEQLMGMVAATSPRNPIPSNIKAGSYYNWLARQGKPLQLPGKGSGYGSIAQKTHLRNAQRILEHGTFDPLQNPKPASFHENLLGNERPMTIDTHEWRQLGQAAKDPRFLATTVQSEKGVPAWKPRQEFKEGKLTMDEALDRPTAWESAPPKGEYGLYEDLASPLVERAGMTPARFQETKWVGGGEETGLASPGEPFLRTLARRIHYTALRMGEDPLKVLDAYVEGKIPLLGTAGVAAGVSALPDEAEVSAQEPVSDGGYRQGRQPVPPSSRGRKVRGPV